MLRELRDDALGFGGGGLQGRQGRASRKAAPAPQRQEAPHCTSAGCSQESKRAQCVPASKSYGDATHCAMAHGNTAASSSTANTRDIVAVIVWALNASAVVAKCRGFQAGALLTGRHDAVCHSACERHKPRMYLS